MADEASAEVVAAATNSSRSCSKFAAGSYSLKPMVRRASLILAGLLQVLPICRGPAAPALAAPASLAIVSRWLASAVTLLGSYDAVSGASAAIAGLVKYSGGTPAGKPTNFVAEPTGLPFKYRITVTNPGTDFDKNYFDCVPLPPGLTINTNLGSAGYITGTPTTTGTYLVTLIAGNLNYATPATAAATLVIYPANTPPSITQPPQNQTMLAGGTATFSVLAAGSWPLSYQWLRNGTALTNATTASLSLTDASSSQAGNYQVFITNIFGSLTSSVARLTIREPFLLEVRLGQPVLSQDGLHFPVTGPVYTNYVVWSSPDLITWTPLQTNWVVDGYWAFLDTNAPSGARSFYRASLKP